MSVRRSAAIKAVAYVLWAAAIAYGGGRLLEFTYTPAGPTQTPLQWPAASPVPLQATGLTLLLFVHPQCPCTKATIGELAVLMAHCREKIHASVFVLKPTVRPVHWDPSVMISEISKIPGVEVSEDRDGRAARLFGAMASGQCLVYDPSGRLVFEGGITSSRGHRGDNNGRSAIQSLALNGRSAIHRTPVFGCLLFEPQAVLK